MSETSSIPTVVIQPSRGWISLTFLVVSLIGIVLVGVAPLRAQQGGDVQWDPPINLSNTPGASTRPAIAVDPWGQVHVFWSEKEGGKPTPPDQAPEVGDTIYYRRWDGNSWSEPVDLFFSTFGGYADPAAAVDSTGTIHLIWIGLQGVYYSQSPALALPTAWPWRPAQLIASANTVDQAELVVGPSDQLYVVYNQISIGGQVFFMATNDGGAAWTEPQQVSEIYHRDAQFTFRPQIAVDARGRVHVTWIEYIGPPEYRGLALYYTSSDDEGLTWSRPINLSEELVLPEESVSGVSLVAFGEDDLLVVYIAGTSVYRRYRFSTDGGQTWSAPRHIFGNFLSRAGWDAMAVDGTGTVHLMVQLRYPPAMYASYWTADRWRDPPQAVLTEAPLNVAHYPQMVISAGNQLHVVMEEHPAGEVWYIHGVTAAPYMPPTPMPDEVPFSMPSAVREMIVTPTPTTMPPGMVNTPITPTSGEGSGTDASYPIWIGVVSVAWVLGIIVAARAVVWRGRQG